MIVRQFSTGIVQAPQPQHPRPVPGLDRPWAPEWPRLTPREIRQIVLDTLG